MKKLKLLSAIVLVLIVEIAFAVPCRSDLYPVSSKINTMAGSIPVDSVKVGDVLIKGSDFLEVLGVVQRNDGYELTTILLSNGPVGPSGVNLDQCD